MNQIAPDTRTRGFSQIAALALGGGVLIIGALILAFRTPDAVVPLSTWISGTSPQRNEFALPDATFDTLPPNTRPTSISGGSEILPLPATPTTEAPLLLTDEDNAITALVARVARERAKPTPSGGGYRGTVSDLFALIQTNFVTPVATRETRSSQQEALYKYGNDVGTLVRTFENHHLNMPELLDAALQNRGNGALARPALAIATDYQSLADNLRTVVVPPEAESAHQDFIRAHEGIAALMPPIIAADTDEKVEEAIEAYGVYVKAYVESYLDLVTLFEREDIQFESLDPGSIFTPVGR